MNILGFNIGQNYKGILNLGSTINTPLSATLQSVTDGMGVASPLQLSTTQVGFEQSSAGYINRWYNSGGTANARKYAVYVANNYWSLTTRNDVEDGGEQFLIATALGGNLSRLELGKSASPLILSIGLATLASSNLVIGTTTATARLHVRGDGTNPILRTEDNSGNAVGFVVSNNSVDIYGRNFSLNGYLVNIFNGLSYGPTSGTVGYLNFNNTIFGAGAGSANFRPINIAYTINNSGAQTGTATGIFLRSTETALNGMVHNFIDLGTIALGSLFSITNKGAIRVTTIANADAPNSSLYFSSDANRLVWKDAGGVVNSLY